MSAAFDRARAVGIEVLSVSSFEGVKVTAASLDGAIAELETLRAGRDEARRIVERNEFLCGDWPADDYEDLLTLLAAAPTAVLPQTPDAAPSSGAQDAAK